MWNKVKSQGMEVYISEPFCFVVEAHSKYSVEHDSKRIAILVQSALSLIKLNSEKKDTLA